MKLKILLFWLGFVFCQLNAQAHDYWLEPKSFLVKPNNQVAVRMLLGSNLVVEEERLFQTERISQLSLFAQNSALDLLPETPRDPASPTFNVRVGAAGNYLLAMQRNAALITLEADKFEAYLREEGLEQISTERKRLNESADFGRERYQRYLKMLIQSGDKRDDTYKKIVGLKLEIVPLENPYQKKAGDKISFRVLFDGKPLESVLLFALNKNKTQIFEQKVRTDSNGKATFTIRKNGLWLIRTVAMRRCETDCQLTDWDSYWASLSFGIN